MMRSYLTSGLLLLNALLAAGLMALWITPQGTVRGLAWEAPAPLKPEISVLEDNLLPGTGDANVSTFLRMLERPLFSPSRRPPPPPPPPKLEQQPEPDPFANIQLQGVYEGGDGGGILARVDGKNLRIPLGGSMGGWIVKGVDGRNVTFSRGGETRSLLLVPLKLATQTSPPPTTKSTLPASGSPAGSQAADPVIREEQERQERERARLALRNARRAANGLPPLTQ